jgi:F-type H+-transporting ATPase subunit b
LTRKFSFARKARGMSARLSALCICAAALVASVRASGEEPHSASPHAGADHPDAAHSEGAHGEEHHQEFNWFHGFIGVKDGVEPDLLWRTPGMPPPFGALLLNTLLLFGIIFKVAKKPVMRGLLERRQRIMRGIDEAAAMKKEAAAQLEMYKSKLANLDSEIERIRTDMRATAELERQRILAEASARSLRLQQEARLLVEQELKGLREQLTRETAQAALRSARELLLASTSTEDHRRLCEQYLQTLAPNGTLLGQRSEST